MGQRAPREPSQRQLRVGELIRHALSEILQRGDIHDADLDGQVITVPEVRLTPDLKIATVYVMPLGGQNADRAVTALARARKQVRRAIARRVELRFVPDFRFVADPSFDEGDRIDALLRSPGVSRDLGPDSPAGTDE